MIYLVNRDLLFQVYLLLCPCCQQERALHGTLANQGLPHNASIPHHIIAEGSCLIF